MDRHHHWNPHGSAVGRCEREPHDTEDEELSEVRRSRRRHGSPLDAVRLEQRKHQLAFGPDGWHDTTAVFTWEDGRRYSPDYVTRQFQDAANRIVLQPIGRHGLRHIWATLALEAGVNPKVVSDRLGHASVAITLDRYTTVRPVIDREAAEAVAAVIEEVS